MSNDTTELCELFFEPYCTGHFQTGSLAGVAHLLYCNTDVPRATPWEQKPHLEHKGKCRLDLALRLECTLKSKTRFSNLLLGGRSVKARPSDPLHANTFCDFWELSSKGLYHVCSGATLYSLLWARGGGLFTCCSGGFGFWLQTFRSGGGVGKITTGITGLWRPSVHSDSAFWFFDVGSSYPTFVREGKGTFVHRSTGNVSWV